MARIAYYRVSSSDQSIESQRAAMGGSFDETFADEGVSGATLAASRPGFGKLLAYARAGDTVSVYAVDRLGRDAIDVQTTVRDLLDRGITVDVHGLGPIAGDAGKIILAVLAQVADMERKKIIERTAAGRATALDHLQRTGKTQHGKTSMGRPLGAIKGGLTVDPEGVRAWKKANSASIAMTARHFGVSDSTVKRYCPPVGGS